jgi:3-hydroxyisobutyrate dehydrogenase-like beta-hydroxyacid dehydrogenase
MAPPGSASARVAFLGLGIMGSRMAARLADAGHQVTVWNRSRARAEALVRDRPALNLASTPAEAARGAEVAITMLADPPALHAVAEGEAGLLAGLPAGARWIEMSTVDPATIEALAAAAAARGVTLLDAPVSGSVRPAAEGKLVIMAAGEAAEVARLTPLLEAMGRVVHVGPRGARSATKLVQKGLGAHLLSGFSSALVLARALGLDPVRTVEVIQQGAFSSPLFSAKLPKVLARDFSTDFSLALMLKDQRLVLGAARAAGLELPTLEAIARLIERGVQSGWGDEDLSALIKVLEAQSGVTVGK